MYSEEIVVKGINYIYLCKSSEVFEKRGKKFSFPGDDDWQVALFKVNGQFHCLYNVCPHRHQPEIYNGIIRGKEISCPVHGWTYSLETGENIIKNQGVRNLKKFDVKVIDGLVYIEKPDFDIPKWRQYDGLNDSVSDMSDDIP